MRAGVKLVHVPYQGSPQAVTDLLAGRMSMMFSPASAVVSQVEAGKLKALASAAAKRPSIAPNLPTMAEAGMPDFDTSIWFGLMAPAGTPREIVDKLARAAREALKSEDVLAALHPQGFDRAQRRPGRFRQDHPERDQALERRRPGGRAEEVAQQNSAPAARGTLDASQPQRYHL